MVYENSSQVNDSFSSISMLESLNPLAGNLIISILGRGTFFYVLVVNSYIPFVPSNTENTFIYPIKHSSATSYKLTTYQVGIRVSRLNNC